MPNYYGNDPNLGEIQAGDEKYVLLDSPKDAASSGSTYKVGTGPQPTLPAGKYLPHEVAPAAQSTKPVPTKLTAPTMESAKITAKPDEFLTATDKLLTGTKAATASKADTTGLDVEKPAQFDVEQGEATRVAGEQRVAEAKQKDEPTFQIGDLDQTVSERAIAEAQTEELDQRALVKFQLEQLYSGFENGQIPAWASGAARKASNIMSSRGLGASSMAAAAIAQSIQESATPIAQADAQSFATIQLQNLNNKQQATLANAATFAAMDRANLDARTTAAVTNAQNFLAIDTANLTNRQQTEIFNAEAHNQALLSDQSAENAMEQLNTENQVEIDRFFSQLGVQINEANSTRMSALRQFNAEQDTTTSVFNAESYNKALLSDQAAANAMEQMNTKNQIEVDRFFAQLGVQVDEANRSRLSALRQFNAEQDTTVSIFNTKTSDQRERFNAEMQAQIEAANTNWKRQITTINNANQQQVNQFAAQSTLAIDMTEYQQLWQKHRDDAARVFTSSENQLDRDTNIVIAQITGREASKMRKSAGTNALITAGGAILGGMFGAQ